MLKKINQLSFAVILGSLCLGGGLSAQAQSALPDDVMNSTVTQVSDALAEHISTSSCQEFSELIKLIPTDGGTPPDASSIMGQLVLSIKDSSNLQGIISSKVGPPLISKMVACNMIPIELLTSALSGSSR
ncbi:hypothetical protein L3556_08535 [Candidatus Synechococcus calcipolaris G9]|uniref:Uncharacterized protein n=1 Tax=Candidatus Synechococcus calcipolaris G9 TaxID=1497997 RepID=A0ABT6EZG4_9SYNE|nr:hypothetical protein [Candidatus Synechococcus calcipolaris]MDG2990972.1 hypothetical protein [Candidatus Synechococcus calcipolaris G9]